MPSSYPRGSRRRQTKLVCTIGPASAERIPELVEAGMDVARVNFSHGTEEQRAGAVRAVRRAARESGRPVAVLGDLSGPKVRLGPLVAEGIELEAGRPFLLRVEGGPGDESGASVTYPALAHDLRPGDRVLLADGAVELQVTSCGDDVVTEVVRGGTIRSRAGVNVPSQRLALPAITEKDERDLHDAIAWEADLVAQSFVRGADDVRELRELLGTHHAQIVAKVETQSAVDDFDAILEEADAVMIARGDLGVELAFEEIPVLQKQLVGRAIERGVPVMVATQMLESMVSAPRPTRAEASDTANAVLDGADAILLSAETAIGAHPVEAARTAVRIAMIAEREGSAYLPAGSRRAPETEPQSIARAATSLAENDERVVAIACFTRTGRTAALLSAARPRVAVFAFSPEERIVRSLALRRSVVPRSCRMPADTDAMIQMMDHLLRTEEGVQEGSLIIMVASTPVGSARTNLLKLHRMGD